MVDSKGQWLRQEDMDALYVPVPGKILNFCETWAEDEKRQHVKNLHV